MQCSVAVYNAMLCSILYCIVVHCSVLQNIAVYFSVLGKTKKEDKKGLNMAISQKGGRGETGRGGTSPKCLGAFLDATV